MLSKICFCFVCFHVQFIKTQDSTNSSDKECEDNIRIDDTCYLLTKHQLSWSRAKFFCESQGMVFARTENLRALSEKVKQLYSRVFSGIWIGATDVDVEGRFIWMDSYTPVVPELWAPGYPNNNNSYLDCAYLDSNFFIRNARCTRKYEVLCQYSVAAITRFGNDKYQCRCSSGKCTEDGECQNPNDLCQMEFFGPKCQFKNVDSTIRGTAGVLQDNDQKTCLENMKSPLEIKLETQQPFSWLRVVLKEKGQLKTFELSYSTSKNLRVGSDKRTETCRDRTYVVQNQKTLDIRCIIELSEVDSLFLTWKGNKSICSIYIFGGRNLAFMQKTTQSGSDPKIAALAVDGRIGGISNCSRGDQALRNHSWELTLPSPAVIFKVVIYKRKGRSGFNFMSGFVLETLTLEDEVVFTHTEDRRDQEPIAKIVSESREPVQKVRLRLEKTSGNSRYLEICELVVYGDCSSPHYGLACSDQCNAVCIKQECHYDGYCYVCPYGKTGRTCTEELKEKDPSDEEVAALVRTYTKLIAATVLAGVVFVLLTALLCYIRQMKIKREILQNTMTLSPKASKAVDERSAQSSRLHKKHRQIKQQYGSRIDVQDVLKTDVNTVTTGGALSGTSVGPTTASSTTTAADH